MSKYKYFPHRIILSGLLQVFGVLHVHVCNILTAEIRFVLSLSSSTQRRRMSSLRIQRSLFDHKCDLLTHTFFVFSGPLQVLNILITIFTPHFNSCTIHGLQGLGKVVMTEKTKLKVFNESFRGWPVSS